MSEKKRGSKSSASTKGGRGASKTSSRTSKARTSKAGKPKAEERQDTEEPPVEKASDAETPADDPGTEAEDAATPEAEDGETPKSGKASLPAFGFASDLLEQGTADDASGRASTDDALAAGLEAETLDPEDPNRIFDFADRLRSKSEQQRADETPVRLETWVTLTLAEETFALPVEPVREVVRVSEITRVPHAPRPIRGVTNLRGRVIPVIDLRLRIGLPEAEALERSARIVSVSSRGRLLGLLVDAVHQVVHLDLNRVQPPPEDVMTVQADYILGVYHQGEQLILLLDVDRALVVREAGAA